MRNTHKISPAEYSTIHHWLRSSYGNANKCESNTCLKQSINFEWALIRGKEYSKDRKCFIQLCKSCHSKYDITELTKKKLSNHFRGRKLTLAQKKHLFKPVIQLTMEGVEIARFSSLIEASKKTGIKNTSITLCLKGYYDYTKDPKKLKAKCKWKYDK